jgi:type II secretory pathway pseudopilin PulG
MLKLVRRRLGAITSRLAFTLLEVVVAVGILGILGTMIVIAVQDSSRVGGEIKRIDDAATVLAALRDAGFRYNLGDRGDTSFTWAISLASAKGTNPGRLSQLTNQLKSTDLNSCAGTFATTYPRWHKNFYPSPISSSTPLHVADGFLADDILKRYDILGNPQANPGTTSDVTTPASVAIVMQNVAIQDAKNLALAVDGTTAGVFPGVVRFTPNGLAPVTVYYHVAVHGC